MEAISTNATAIRALLATLGLAVAIALPGEAAAETPASPANATTRIAADPSEPFQSWVHRSLTPTPRGEVEIRFGRSPQQGGLRLIWWWGPEHTGEGNRPMFYHEIGHVFDSVRLRAWSQERFMTILDRSPAWRGPWNDLGNSPAEQFAMAYSYCALGVDDPEAWGRENNWWGYGYGDGHGVPTVRQQARACGLIERVARDPRPPPCAGQRRSHGIGHVRRALSRGKTARNLLRCAHSSWVRRQMRDVIRRQR